MALITLRDITISFGGDPVLDGVAFQLESGQKVCLLGRNGEGKTTLMKIISGELEADGGMVQRQPDLRVARLPQDVPQDLAGTVFDVVADGLGEFGQAIAEYHHASVAAESGDADALRELGECQHRLEALGAWALGNQVETVLTQMDLAAEALVESLSGGMKRRVLLARALVSKPEILLLDEPTNHLDIEAIGWLEKFLCRFPGTVLFVTHDRAFMRKVATRILELDRGAIFDWACDYDTFLKRKQQLLDDEQKRNERADRRLSQEEAWIRQGIKARRTRNEGRVKRLEAMRDECLARRQQSGNARVVVQSAERSGNLVVRTENASFSYGDTRIIDDLTTTIQRGDRVGIIGPNGCGKTTLIKLLLGQLEPQNGKLKSGTRLQIVYFDQLRQALDPSVTVFETVNDGKDKVLINGHWRSVFSYLQDFLFTPDRARSPVTQLSGGEKNRLMLAKLLTQPANLLVMDEPTNDLDVETLELLEEKLLEFEGTLLLVSHDREFINNVVTSTLVFENGGIREYAGGYDDWISQKSAREAAQSTAPAKINVKKTSPGTNKKTAPRKRSYREEREMEELPNRIEKMENRQQEIYVTLGNSEIYQNEAEQVAKLKTELAEVESNLEKAYARWEELEAIS